MNIILTFQGYSKSVTAYRTYGPYQLMDVQFRTTPEAELERFLSLSDAFLDDETGEWTNSSGRVVAQRGDTKADMGDYTIVCYDLTVIEDTDIDLLDAMRKDGCAYTLAEEIVAGQ